MEGNLRGARDLVQPLTAANLKRATSVGSYASPMGAQGMRGRYVHDGYQYEPSPQQQQQRKLQAQASFPTIGHDYQGHYRGFSEFKLPSRPHTSLERTNTPIGVTSRVKDNNVEPAWTNSLKESRSHDSLGKLAIRRPTSRGPSYTRVSPDPNLGVLAEDDGQEADITLPHSRFSDREEDYFTNDGSSRSSSRTEDLREQMSSLKGKISDLKQRAREDSVRRASMQNLRDPSPLNNAASNAPEFFYTQSQTYGSPVLDTNAGVGWSSPNYSPVLNQTNQQTFEPQQVLTGSRNAFAEPTQHKGSDHSSQNSSRKGRETGNATHHHSKHKRTPSGTAIVQSSKHRYSHHHQYHVRNDSGDSANSEPPRGRVGMARGDPLNDDTASQSEASIYEDAATDQQTTVVAHEDRVDAFDYQQFWMNNALGRGHSNDRRGSTSSEESGSSIETARGPTRDVEAGDEEYDDANDDPGYPPASPETPERLREIEQKLHKRTLSNESVSTVATFATATEGRASPPAFSRQSSATSVNWPMPRSEPHSRPATAIPLKRPSPTTLTRSNSSSERADSGLGLTNRPASSQSAIRSPLKTTTPNISTAFSPPMSPRTFADPATLAVNAILNSNGRPLGLKDKALLFSLVESLRTVCHQIQEGTEGDFHSRALRRRLDDARKILNGAMS